MPANRTAEGLTRGDALIHGTIKDLLNFEKYTSFPDALRGAAIANDFQMILLSADMHPVFSVETRHRTTVGAAVRLGKDYTFSKAAVYTKIDVNGILTYWGPVTVQEQPYLMFVVDNEDQYSAEEMTRLGKLIELAMQMWHFSPVQDARSEFLRALRRNNAAMAYSLRGEAGVDPACIAGVFVVRAASPDEAESLCESLERAGLGILRMHEEGETSGILLAGGKADAASGAAEIYRTYEPGEGTTVFHITGIRGPEGAGSAFALIQAAREAACIIHPQQAVFGRYDLALARSAALIYEQDPVQRQEYASWFDPFRDLTAAKRKQLLDTLEVFLLDAAQSTQQTAQLLGVHANTVQYRLHRVEEKMGLSLLQGPAEPGLILALALRRLERADRSRRQR